MNRRCVRHAVASLLVVVAASLAACGGAEPATSPATGTTSAVRSSSPSATMPTATRPPVLPETPAQAVRRVGGGWYKVVERAYASLDVSELRANSAELCGRCVGQIQSVQSVARAKRRYAGGVFSVRVVRVEVFDKQQGAAIIDVTYSGGRVVDASGRTVETIAAARTRQQVTVLGEGGRWRVAAIFEAS